MIEYKKMSRCFMNGKSCIYERTISERIDDITQGKGQKKAFTIMPFFNHLNALYKWQIAPFITAGGGSAESKYKCEPERADDVRQVGYIMCEKICKKIQEANYIVAELSYNNPNVFYELGISIALKREVLPLCLEENFDQRQDLLSRMFGFERLLKCPSFGFMGGKISDFIIKPRHEYSTLERFQGSKLVVLHDGRNISIPVKNGERLNYKFGDLCKSAAGVAIKDIFSDDNIKEHPELAKYRGSSSFEKIEAINVQDLGVTEVTNGLKDTYCVLVDTNTDCPASYFWLGFIHAIGGFAIPVNITNVEAENKQEDSATPKVAFDIRALWHIYFDVNNPITLSESLKEILEFVFIEQSRFLERDKFWNNILTDNKVSIFLGSINIPELGRNTLGDWDYRTAAELTSFLSRKKETMEVTLESPIQKSIEKPSNEHSVWLSKQLQDKNCIIVASSDVNDLTEICFSEIWRKDPFQRIADDDTSFNGFIAYKKYKTQPNSVISQSAFFESTFMDNNGTNNTAERGFKIRLGDKTTERMITEPHFFPDEEEAANGIHVLLGQLVICRNPFVTDINNEKWIIVISGISGPATLGIAQMLTGCIYSEFTVNKLALDNPDEFDLIQEWLNDKKNAEILGVNNNDNYKHYRFEELSENRLKSLNSLIGNKQYVDALISVGVYYPQIKPFENDNNRQFHDERKIVAWNFTDIAKSSGVQRKNPFPFSFEIKASSFGLEA